MRSLEELRTEIARQVEMRDNLFKRIDQVEQLLLNATEEQYRLARTELEMLYQGLNITAGLLGGLYYSIGYPEDEVIQRLNEIFVRSVPANCCYVVQPDSPVCLSCARASKRRAM